jgi:hypothetical protein
LPSSSPTATSIATITPSPSGTTSVGYQDGPWANHTTHHYNSSGNTTATYSLGYSVSKGYPYQDVKNGPNQDISGSDGIGDVAIGEEIFDRGGTNIDRYPIMTKVVIGVDNPSVSPSVLPSAMPSQSPAYHLRHV